ncbi:MAG: hypothetical protein K9L61_04405, partial [Candidatus Omnitrophica bacterium]|nr:hypothetical protein [Candidatus Omnitrophota bacterium]
MVNFYRISISFFSLLFMIFITVYPYNIEKGIEKGDVPLPYDAEEISISAMPFGAADSVIYKTSMEKSKLFLFYKNKLVGNNWTYEDTLYEKTKGMDIPKPPISGSGSVSINPEEFLKSVYQFKRGPLKLTLMILPTNTKIKYTIFSIAIFDTGQSKELGFNGKDEMNRSYIWDSKIPFYPKSKKIKIGENFASFSADAKVSEITDFYKIRMPGRGWVLDKEVPLTKEERKLNLDVLDKVSGDFNKVVKDKECLSCNPEKIKSTMPSDVKDKMKGLE